MNKIPYICVNKSGDGEIYRTNKNMNATVKTTTVTQSANEVLGTKEKTLYYLIIETAKGKLTINVGDKTHKQVTDLTNVVTKLEGIGGKEK